jgi:hypothetical protein
MKKKAAAWTKIAKLDVSSEVNIPLGPGGIVRTKPGDNKIKRIVSKINILIIIR